MVFVHKLFYTIFNYKKRRGGGGVKLQPKIDKRQLHLRRDVSILIKLCVSDQCYRPPVSFFFHRLTMHRSLPVCPGCSRRAPVFRLRGECSAPEVTSMYALFFQLISMTIKSGNKKNVGIVGGRGR